MRKALLCLIFAVAVIAQPSEVGVDLSVVSVDSGSGEVCFKAIVTSTGPLPTPPEFAYDYDWENDATWDLTDAGDSVCHTYTPGDSLWAKVKATTATYTAQDSAEVVLPEGGIEYVFDIVMDGDGSVTDYYVSDTKGLLLQRNQLEWTYGADTVGEYYWIIEDPTGVIDTIGSKTLHNPKRGNNWENQDNNSRIEFDHVLHDFYSYSHMDTIIWSIADTVIDSVYKFDSLTVKPIDYDYSPYKVDTTYSKIDYIADSGWMAISIRHETTYDPYVLSYYEHLILKDGEVYSQLPDEAHPIKMENGVVVTYPGESFRNYNIREFYDYSGNYLYEIELDTTERFYDEYILADNSVVTLTVLDNDNKIDLRRKNQTSDYSYELINRENEGANSIINGDKLFVIAEPDTSVFISYLYYFDLSDSIELIWQDTLEGYFIPEADFLETGEPFIVLSGRVEPKVWQVQVLNKQDGSVLATWPEEPMPQYGLLDAKLIKNYLSIWTFANEERTEFYYKLVHIVREGGE